MRNKVQTTRHPAKPVPENQREGPRVKAPTKARVTVTATQAEAIRQTMRGQGNGHGS